MALTPTKRSIRLRATMTPAAEPSWPFLYPSGTPACDLRRCPIEDRKALLCAVIGDGGVERIVFVDHMIGNGATLFEAVRQIGTEGIVSKRAGSRNRGGPSRDWLKAKVSETGAFVITGLSSARRSQSPNCATARLSPSGWSSSVSPARGYGPGSTGCAPVLRPATALSRCGPSWWRRSVISDATARVGYATACCLRSAKPHAGRKKEAFFYATFENGKPRVIGS